MSNISLRTGVATQDYQAVRDETEALAAPLSPEDQQIQSMDDASPTKWHRAHTTWFFETFLLIPHLQGYSPFDPMFQFLYNSYYVSAGDRHARDRRGLISRPTCEEVSLYRKHVDRAMGKLITSVVPTSTEVHDLVILGLHHEQQHQELLVMDIKHVLAQNPIRPKYHQREIRQHGPTPDCEWKRFDGGLIEIGYRGDDFHFDNEGPRHRRYLEPFELATRPVTNGEWLDFMANDGYHNPLNWLSAGWASVTAEGWEAPMYWEPTESGWFTQTLHGFVPVPRGEPVCHISYFEADAFARWAGARLPTEAEWEHAASDQPVSGNFASSGALHPLPNSFDTLENDELHQLFGDVWEWTSSSYDAYPGFTPAPGAVGEYNGKFMVNQYVLRGGCCATPAGHTRATYRNFFPTHSRWMFSGVRLAKTV